MKLCISAAGVNMDARVDTAFGRAPYFLIIDTVTMEMEVMENGAAAAGHGAGIAAAQLVSDKGIDAVLSGYVGPNAFQALRAAGIRVFEGAAEDDTVREAVTKFNENKFKETSTPPQGPGCGRGMRKGLGRRRGGRGCRFSE